MVLKFPLNTTISFFVVEKLSKLGKPLEEVTEEDMRKIDEFVKTVTHKIYKHSTHNYVPIE